MKNCGCDTDLREPCHRTKSPALSCPCDCHSNIEFHELGVPTLTFDEDEEDHDFGGQR